MFIAFEGIDGSGKTTISRALIRQAESLGKSVALSPQPTYWFNRINVDLSTMSNLEHIALFSADRGLDQEALAMEIDNKDIVIRDRYMFSTYAYNCVKEEDIAVYEGLNRNFIKPDLTVLIDTPIDICLKRIESRSNEITYFEKRNLAEIRNRYLRKMSIINWSKSLIIDGSQDIEDIITQVLGKIGIFAQTEIHNRDCG